MRFQFCLLLVLLLAGIAVMAQNMPAVVAKFAEPKALWENLQSKSKIGSGYSVYQESVWHEFLRQNGENFIRAEMRKLGPGEKGSGSGPGFKKLIALANDPTGHSPYFVRKATQKKIMFALIAKYAEYLEKSSYKGSVSNYLQLPNDAEHMLIY